MYLTREQITKVLRRAYRESPRDHAMFLLAYTHGLRESEIAALTLDSIINGVLSVHRVKGSLATTQALHANTNPLFDEPSVLERWMRELPREGNIFGRLFPITTRQMRRLAKTYMVAAGASEEDAHFHQLKHACGSQLYRNGMPLAELQRFLGHKDIKNTMVYVNMSDAEASAKATEVFRSMA